jgi:hypothetical protein
MQDKVDTIRLLVLGVSAHQKLELLERLLVQLGYETVTVFGDCFDEVGSPWTGLVEQPAACMLLLKCKSWLEVTDVGNWRSDECSVSCCCCCQRCGC